MSEPIEPVEHLEPIAAMEATPIDTSQGKAEPRCAGPIKRKKLTLAERQVRAKESLARIRKKIAEAEVKAARKPKE